jgi:hypothetical protein
VIDSWQRIAGPDVDLDREWLMYLAKRGMTPPRDPWAAWVGWLQQAARHAAAARGSPPIGCDACLSGWIPDEFGWASERPCPTCKPHIAI